MPGLFHCCREQVLAKKAFHHLKTIKKVRLLVWGQCTGLLHLWLGVNMRGRLATAALR